MVNFWCTHWIAIHLSLSVVTFELSKLIHQYMGIHFTSIEWEFFGTKTGKKNRNRIGFSLVSRTFCRQTFYAESELFCLKMSRHHNWNSFNCVCMCGCECVCVGELIFRKPREFIEHKKNPFIILRVRNETNKQNTPHRLSYYAVSDIVVDVVSYLCVENIWQCDLLTPMYWRSACVWDNERQIHTSVRVEHVADSGIPKCSEIQTTSEQVSGIFVIYLTRRTHLTNEYKLLCRCRAALQRAYIFAKAYTHTFTDNNHSR